MGALNIMCISIGDIMMKCIRCNEVDVPSMHMWGFNHIPTEEQIRDTGYCYRCLMIDRFERVKFAKRPYKIPIDRKGV